MDEVKFYVGLDVHKDSIAIAFARAHARDDPQFVGTTRYSMISLTKALSKLGQQAIGAQCLSRSGAMWIRVCAGIARARLPM